MNEEHEIQQKEVMGSRIRAARHVSPLTMEEIALAVGVSRQALVQWETGATSPSLSRLVRLVKALNVSVNYLLGLSDQTDEEELLLASYRQYSEHDRDFLRRMMEPRGPFGRGTSEQ